MHPLVSRRASFCFASALLSACVALGPRSLAAVESAASGVPAGYEAIAKPYLAAHCLTCHGEKAKAGYRVDRIGLDFAAPTVAEQWKELIDRVNAGEMPPDGHPQPAVAETTAFVDWVNRQLREVDLRAKNAGGRIPMRRLNRDELANTLRDLLQLDEQIVRPLLEEMPADGTAEGFDRLGAALFFDRTQIERSLDAMAKIAARTIVVDAPKTNRVRNSFEIEKKRPPAEQVEVFPGFKHTIPRGARERLYGEAGAEVLQGGPTYRREYLGWGSVTHFSVRDAVTQDGYYRVRIQARVDDRARKEPNKFRIQYAWDSPIQVEKEVAVDPSGTTEAVVFLRGPVNGEVKGPQVLRVLWNHTEKVVIMEPKYEVEFVKWRSLRGAIEQAVTRRAPKEELDELYRRRAEIEKVLNAWTGQAYVYNPALDIESLPRLHIASIEIEGPIQLEWPPASHKQLLFAGDERTDDAYVREIFAKFLPRAYRRPATAAEVDAAAAVVSDARAKSNLMFHDAMRVGLQRVLCSPGFLFLEEPIADGSPPRPLTDYELASRLSFFLWSSMPDDELFALAAAGKLRDPATSAAQVQRMLADPKAGQFVQNFAGQWLSVRDFGSIKPAAEYRDYDRALEQASQQEPFAFFTEVLQQNLPITAFLDSDFLVVNERLARHYGIEGVTGSEFRRVSIGPERHRGGVLGMAGLMTYLADGTRTLPMRRGTWVLRELLNDPPNAPPPNAGEIQPNTGGKNLTLRERLERHRNDDVCASCHAKLDPYGLALENYDAIGAWRERFNGEGYQGRDGPKLDVSGSFPDGRKFTTLEEYKAGLLESKDRFARAFSTKLLTYALGRPVGYADHDLLDELVAELKRNDYRLQPLIHAVAASDAFRTK